MLKLVHKKPQLSAHRTAHHLIEAAIGRCANKNHGNTDIYRGELFTDSVNIFTEKP